MSGTATQDPGAPARRARAAVQRFGGRLAGMVLPNIGAFIAWGLCSALFTPAGWLPNPYLAQLNEPMIKLLLPLLIGYTGGSQVHGRRGAVVGAVATAGIATGADIPMFLGAMIVGPLAGWVLKQFDERVGKHVAPGFKMLVDNFSAGIIGGVLAILGMLAIGPVIESATVTLGQGVRLLIGMHLLPLVSVFVEPAKVLFLNNAVNHGVLGPLGVSESMSTGKAIEFLVEPNPGPGLGLLLAVALFGAPAMRSSAPGAMVIQFLGGIHEIYFPYVLAAPRLLLATVAGSAAGVFVFSVTGAGVVATPSPGSVVAVLAVTPKGGFPGVIAGIAASAVVSFVVAALLLKLRREPAAGVAEGGAVS